MAIAVQAYAFPRSAARFPVGSQRTASAAAIAADAPARGPDKLFRNETHT